MTVIHKIKFNDERAGEVTTVDGLTTAFLPKAEHGDLVTHATERAGSQFEYKFDPVMPLLALALNMDTWFGVEDIDELIVFLKAAKKRSLKLQAKRA